MIPTTDLYYHCHYHKIWRGKGGRRNPSSKVWTTLKRRWGIRGPNGWLVPQPQEERGSTRQMVRDDHSIDNDRMFGSCYSSITLITSIYRNAFIAIYQNVLQLIAYAQSDRGEVSLMLHIRQIFGYSFPMENCFLLNSFWVIGPRQPTLMQTCLSM